VAVSLSYTIELPQKQGRWGQWKGITYLSNWHPVLAVHDAEAGWQPTPFVPWHQPWFNEAGVFTARVRLPLDQKVACTGSITKVEEAGDLKELSIGPVTARDFALLSSAEYHEFVGEATNGDAGTVKVRCMAHPDHAFYAQALIKHASRAIEEYSKWFGPLPYPEFTIAESFFGWNGNECGGLVMIDERVFKMPHLAEGYVQYLISHETLHQWFYNVVGTNGYKETFMDEAIVVHLTHRLLDQLEGKNNQLLNYPPGLAFLPGIKRENYRYATFYQILKNEQVLPALLPMEKYQSPIGLFAAVYDRGSKVVGMIEDRLGPVAFLEFMRRIYTKYYFRIITVADFQRELEEYTGRKWDGFFKEWLTTAGMSDWAVDNVSLTTADGGPVPKHCPPGGAPGPYRATVILSQRAQIDEDTVIGFSFDNGTSYPIRFPIKAPPRRKDPAAEEKKGPPDPKKGEPGGGEITPSAAFLDKHAIRCERLNDTHIRIEVELPGQPTQVSVDPDQVLPDANPANNHWVVPINYRPRLLYNFLDETAFTNDYDKWNVIYGPWVYGAPYPEDWFTRASVLGGRVGLYRLEEFRGGVYAGYRPTFGDLVYGFDAHYMHWPAPKWEVGAHGEVSIGQFLQNDNYNPDRFVVWLRHNIEPTSSLYLPPREYHEVYFAFQNNWMPDARYPRPGTITIDPLTTIGVHYRRDSRIPYWDPETGTYLDAHAAVGLPVFGENRVSAGVWGQYSWTTTLPNGVEYFGSDTKLAVRVGGAVGLPQRARLFPMGGNLWYRGFDVFERQGSCLWLASVELRVPLKRDIGLELVDRILRLNNLYVAPFYDVGDVYVDGHSLGPVAHAVGLGLRFDVAFFSFLERATVRLDIAQTIGQDTRPQFWFGLQQPF
jgi:hypothetical protein